MLIAMIATSCKHKPPVSTEKLTKVLVCKMMLFSQAASPLALLVFVEAAKGENLTKCVTSCQDQWEEMANRCYLWPEEKLSWEDAEHFCNNLEGHLASVTDEKIHKYLRSKVNIDDGLDDIWVGGSDQEEKRVWTWTDGSPWNFTRWATGPVKQPDAIRSCLGILHRDFISCI